jgi:putative ABC transport system substrate-binding protein
VRRREFLGALGGAAATWPLTALTVFAQEAGRTYRLGLMNPSGREALHVIAFFDELRLNGFIEGKNLTVIIGGFDVPIERIAEQAAALVKAAPDVIQTGYVLALQSATRSIPLVGTTEDMVAEGLVASLARPGGNTTGISILSPELDGKRQGILMEAVPRARRMAALADTKTTPPRHLQAMQDAAKAHGVELSVFAIAKRDEIAAAIKAAQAAGAEALNFLATPLFSVNRQLVFEAVAALRLPAMYQWPEMAEEGGLMSYGSRITQMYRQSARLVVKVLRGAKPADLPVEQPTHFELVINLRTAKAIGHEIPAGLVLRADKLIE